MSFQTVLDEVSVGYAPRLIAEVSQYLAQSGLTIAVAESVTGGMLGEALTTYPGGSEYFMGGVICYSNALKVKLAQVNPATIAAHGVVSEAVTREMVDGIHRLTGASIALATNGVAGPHPVGQSEVGTVILGVRFQHDVIIKRLEIEGNRTVVRQRATLAAFGILKQWLMSQQKGD